ncbi:PREDICTED: electrogenic sodium bicarbonate cotransporter 1-like isoform X2 [Branchiostoma belcheri]|uniref:Anion exchange protein n=1 Tax=Branchiostoma belcheri TaxID=7741 RepID=A0A6P4XPD0_BRABE|nr:PREDICTED: electrogenic sodium bicarbonate cotransporter 1-like isoform X2 [Branchiostoma belcheri]
MDLSVSGYDEQPVLDTRAASAARLADRDHTDFDRHKNVYVGVHVPLKHRHQKKRSGKNGHHKSHRKNDKDNKDNVPTPPVTPPSQRVQFILGGDDETEKKETPTIFTEMEELHMGEDMEMEWKECARWVKFEEDVEEGGDRWSKPHVATLSLHSLFELRSCILTGTVLLDMDANHLTDIANLVLDNMVLKGQLQEEDRDKVLNALLSRHHHQTRRSKAAMFPMVPSLASLRRNFSNPNKLNEQGSESQSSFPRIASSASMRYESTTPEEPGTSTPPRINSTASFAKSKHFMRKIPEGSEASNVLVGEVDFLKRPIIAFVRLSHSLLLGDITEVPIPTRFLFFMLGPQGNQKQYHEVGRAIATLMSDEVFHNVAYRAKNRQDLLAGIDEFLDQVTVLPPGEWDPNIRIEPPSNIPSQEGRKGHGQDNGDGEKEEEYDSKEELKRTGRLFGGLIDDIKRKAPHYLSDFKDGISLQCLSSVLFLYFACITPVITFGGLLGDATENYQAALENIFSAAICGTTYHLLSGQPLTIIGSTGPILVYETLMYDFCKGNKLEYLPFRVWVGLWTCFILLVMVATDASALVKYFTRFVEESFAALIAFIFIVEAFKKLYHITDHYMVKKWWLESQCTCLPPEEKNDTATSFVNYVMGNDTNMTSVFSTPSAMSWNYSMATDSPLNVTDTTPFNDFEVIPTSASDGIPWENLTQHDCLIVHHGHWVGENCDYAPDVFLMSVVLMAGTFFLASTLKSMKTERFFPTMVRGVICDFAVFISVLTFVGIDAAFGVDTPKLLVPIEFKPTRSDRGWFINPVGNNPWWVGIAAVIPALLAVILIFMDQQITAVIVNRKEHKLKKGAGYHLDLFIVAILIGITSLLGLPWFVAATVLSLNHVNSLKMESDCSAPGEKPKFLGVRENRVTGLVVFLLIGLSVLFTSILRLVPMPVLYGVFLYMGFSSLAGIQFWDRLLLVLMPPKHQPDYVYLRHVPLKRVHLFTFIQLMCLVILWVIKSTDASLVFPIMVLALVFVRKLMDYLFVQADLEYLDDKMPEMIKRKKADKEMAEEEFRERSRTLEGADFLEVMDQTKDEIGGNITIPVEAIQYNPKSKTLNISEEVAKTAIWKTLAGDTQKRKKSRRSKKSRPGDLTLKDGPNAHADRKPTTKNGELSPLIEEGGITINIPPPWQDNDAKKQQRPKDVEEGKSPLIKVQAPSPSDSPDVETTV